MLEEDFKVSASESDSFQNMRLSSLLKRAEEISIDDVTRLGMGREKTLDKGLLWVISRLSFSFKRWPKYDENCCLLTFPEKRCRFLFPRYYQLKSEKGEVLLEGEAIWALINQETRKIEDPLKAGIHIASRPFEKALNPDLGMKEFLPASSEKRKVRFEDLDLNGHMTNAAYAAWVISIHPSSFYIDKRISSFKLAFYKEAKEGQNLVLSWAQQGKEETVSGTYRNEKIFSAYIAYE